MKLDRNINPDGRGKYALINMRRVAELTAETCASPTGEINQALRVLAKFGALTYGFESEGEQFFVMKYKDRFTAAGLRGYAKACREESDAIREGCGRTNRAEGSIETANSLEEFAYEIDRESERAAKLGKKLPD